MNDKENKMYLWKQELQKLKLFENSSPGFIATVLKLMQDNQHVPSSSHLFSKQKYVKY